MALEACLPETSPRTTPQAITDRRKSAASVTVSTVDWKPQKGGIVILSASVPAAARVGDILVDSAANSFLIQSIGTDWLGLTYFDYEGEPATGAGSIDEAYTSATLWETDIPDIPDGGISLASIEKGLILKALQKSGGNRSEAARLLHIPRHVLIYRIEKFGIT